MKAASDPSAVLRAALELLEGRAPVRAGAMASVIGRRGSAPQGVGARLLWREDGELFGTVGGGAIEAQVLEACARVVRRGRSERLEAQLVRDLGMCCGGTMEVFVEYLRARPRLFLIGAGHVAQALAPWVSNLDFRVHVIDDREELLSMECFSDAECLCYDADELADCLTPGEDDHFLIFTRDHLRDERALDHLLEQEHAYLGMIGSQRKVHRVLGRVLHRRRELGREDPDLSRLRAPVGLSLGGKTPAEIAASIAAELVATRCGGDGSAMSIAHKVEPGVDPTLEPRAEPAGQSNTD